MNKRLSRSGITMVETVSALMLFILIMGALTMALDKVTLLWGPSESKQHEHDKTRLILSMLSDDLQQAVTDNGSLDLPNREVPPTFLCDATTNQQSTVKILLQFIRHRSRTSRFSHSTPNPPALDAVFYTFYQNSLFRHLIPLEYKQPDNPEHIGDLLTEARALVDDASLHANISGYLKAPLSSAEPSANWEYSLLADKLTQPVILIGIPSAYVRKSSSNLINPASIQMALLQAVPEYDKLEIAVLPDYLDIAIRIFNDADWANYIKLFDSSADDITIVRKNASLGLLSSRRISFKTTRGARLP